MLFVDVVGGCGGEGGYMHHVVEGNFFFFLCLVEFCLEGKERKDKGKESADICIRYF